MSLGLQTALTLLVFINFSLVSLLELARSYYARTEIALQNIPFSCVDSSADTSCVWPVVGDKLAYLRFEDSKHYPVDNSSTAEREWAALSPENGVVHLKVGSDSDIREFTPSMFHQLRCLDILRAHYARLSSGDAPATATPSSDTLSHHCLNYLRQTLLCNSDLHLDPVFGATHKDADLIAHTHICRDWTAAYKELKRNQRWYHDISNSS
ncbi:hypothetical protein V5O48_015032 [Marasmius crinis-equi]|uniref:Uncharacterized protein n=1 Tax=Marasmius crinis-equi TaxID=585013 RepID=A0ABR3EVM2_9AGAR